MAKPKSQTPDAPKQDYAALDPIRFNGDDYDVGDTISLTDDEAAPLAALGVIGPQAPKPAAPQDNA